MIRKETVYRIGRIGKPHGVDGEVSFHFDDDVFDWARFLPAAHVRNDAIRAEVIASNGNR